VTVRKMRQYEIRGEPAMLGYVPSAGELRAAGAGRTAEKVARAVELRDRAREARRATEEARAALRQAEAVDRSEHAAQVAEDPEAKLTPKHVQRAERRLEDLERRHRALVEATEVATSELIEVGEQESEALVAAARATRTRAVEEVAAAAERIEAQVDGLQRALSIARWSTEPDSRRWKVGLGAAHVGKRHGGVPIAQLIEGVRELADVLSAQPTPDEEREQPGIKFGWPKPGQLGPPPGSMRVS
jgi:hypothetical protein